ncbi:hypothetical protein GPL15_12030 [Clostridium sp. MCC353]|uniref:cache domain-containing sensor histidine kinase n=1 Tax=Clostridium sp. MCC353 TaxID=2592646 RepID=UPI001C014AB7|nr:histidine kinase [Clostridium sp. MCC353]MBT9777230.1 hypothetical protein [Clostridium sp. MCC353]
MSKNKSFSLQLLKNFLISTLIPFMLVTTVIANTYSRNYNKDVHILLNATVDSMISSISTYLDELQQITLLPYYNDEMYYYLKNLSLDHPYENVLDEISLRRNLDSNMSFVRYNRADTNGIFIVEGNRCLYYTTINTDQKTLVQPYDYSAQTWYKNAIEANGRCIILGPHTPDYISPCDPPVISLVRSIMVLNTREPLCVIKFDINTSLFDRIFNEFSFHVDSKIIIKDENQQIIYTNAPLNAQDKNALSHDLPETKVSLEDGIYKTYSYPVKDYPWTITILLSNAQLRSRTSIVYLAALLLYLVGVVTAALSYVTVSKKMVRAIDSMKSIFLAIQNKDFSKRYHYVSNTELDELGDSLNQTVIQLENKIQKEYLMTIQQKNIEFHALQSQIQPHFLFNTLNNFIALNQVGQRDSLENALYELSDMLRYVLKAPSLVGLTMELEFIEDYCALQKLRFSDRLSYEIRLNTPVSTYRIPKLLLQPIVENSILHGIEPCEHPCHITIDVSCADEYLVITVSDDGVGCSVEEIQNSIGLTNVKERLHFFSAQSRFEMESAKGKGTRTAIYLSKNSLEERQ